jgi:hypothetical protein
MKTFLIALAFVGANAMACPDAKDALAPSTDKPVVAVVKAKPAAQQLRASTKTVTKVAVKQSTDARKATTL